MNPEALYTAQLNVSKMINDELVDDLISRLSILGKSNYIKSTKCIDIDLDRESTENDYDTILLILKEWLFDMGIKIDIYNIKFLFNITKTDIISNHIIHVYLY